MATLLINKPLVLHVKKIWFDKIKSGKKKIEYRKYNDYWRTRLLNKKYSSILILCGYPKKNGLGQYPENKALAFNWDGYRVNDMTHPDTLINGYCFCISLKKPLGGVDNGNS